MGETHLSHKTRETYTHTYIHTDTHTQTCVRVYKRLCPSTIKFEFLVQTVLRKVKPFHSWGPWGSKKMWLFERSIRRGRAKIHSHSTQAPLSSEREQFLPNWEPPGKHRAWFFVTRTLPTMWFLKSYLLGWFLSCQCRPSLKEPLVLQPGRLFGLTF